MLFYLLLGIPLSKGQPLRLPKSVVDKESAPWAGTNPDPTTYYQKLM